ncbi:tol-pal system-associated acyl-CoA thioesterase [Histidinibacterium aquaticum]|uniref:Tol-pal system-associated acyl-CoA thioesterase n=1 Tax=Histidinibacterium aquaticum TaxID=2613962 RepID=A0A5J5GPM5_9RHOB|nr:tol-pal system-associated acyl-CoA thioesterase [Histidinibacterium aquaticum]KAA9010289.1 tol-pal system-associated acyl-CoA thioesterase [Histidinibacterium aquaticum]
MTHRFTCRVYYEDTDLAGIVYHANYLKFIERARTEWVRELGVDQGRLKAEEGLVFVVRRIDAEYLRPAKFDDVLAVETEVAVLGGSRLELDQRVLRESERLFAARVTLVAVGEDGRPRRLPATLRERLAT